MVEDEIRIVVPVKGVVDDRLYFLSLEKKRTTLSTGFMFRNLSKCQIMF